MSRRNVLWILHICTVYSMNLWMDFFVTFLYLWSKCSHIMCESKKTLCLECSWTAELYYYTCCHASTMCLFWCTFIWHPSSTHMYLPYTAVHVCLSFVERENKKRAHSLTLLNPCNLEHLYCCEGTCNACHSQLSNMTGWWTTLLSETKINRDSIKSPLPLPRVLVFCIYHVQCFLTL